MKYQRFQKKSLVVCIFAAALVALTAVAVNAAILNVPADYSQIQDAINASSPGDVVNVAAGTYNESISLNMWKNGVKVIGAGSTPVVDYDEPERLPSGTAFPLDIRLSL